MSRSAPKAVAMLRVSTRVQETDRQRFELLEKAKEKGWEVVEVIEEKVSGAASEEDRVGIARALELAKKGKIQKVMVHEVTRIARKNSITHKFVEELTEAGVSLYWLGHNMETLLPNGKSDTVAGIMLALLSENAKNELDFIRERTKSGLEAAKRKGVVLGRPKGSEGSERFLERNKAAVALIRENPNLSQGQLAKLAGVSVVTIRKVMQACVNAKK